MKSFIHIVAPLQLIVATTLSAATPEWLYGVWRPDEDRLKTALQASVASKEENAADIFNLFQIAEGSVIEINSRDITFTKPKRSAFVQISPYQLVEQGESRVIIQVGEGPRVIAAKDKESETLLLSRPEAPSVSVALVRKQLTPDELLPEWLQGNWHVELSKNAPLLARLNARANGDRSVLDEMRAFYRGYKLHFKSLGGVIEVSEEKRLMEGKVIQKDDAQVTVQESDGSLTKYIRMSAEQGHITMKDENNGEEIILTKLSEKEETK